MTKHKDEEQSLIDKAEDPQLPTRKRAPAPTYTYYLVPNGDRGDLDEYRIALAWLQENKPDVFDTAVEEPTAEVCTSINLHVLRENEQIVVVARGLRGRKRSDRWKVDLKKGEADPIPHDDPALTKEVIESPPLSLSDARFWERSTVYGRSGKTICRSEICTAIAQTALPFALKFADNGSDRSSVSRNTLNPSNVPMVVYLGLV